MKILSTEINLGSASNVSNASVVRLFNSGTDNILVTRKDYAGTVVGSFMVPAGQVVYGEKYFTDTLEASADVKASKTAYSSMMSFVGQTADPLPTYTASVSASAVDEGGNFTTTVTTTNVDDGTSFNYVLSGTNITSADFSSGSLTGTITISNNTASFSHTVAEDTLTEGTETFTIKIYDASLNYVGNTLTVSINDTSLTPPPTYTPTINHTSRDEGDSFTTTMTTTNVANSTELFWELSGTGIAAGDFSSGALTGSGTISSNTFNFSHTIASDNTTEGTETLNIKFYSDSGRTTQVGSTLTCTINDTSITPPIRSISYDGNDAVIWDMNSSSMDWGTNENVTFECWFYIHSFSGSWNVLFGRWKGGAYTFLAEINNNGRADLAIGDGSNYYTSMNSANGVVSAGAWHHYAAVKNGNNGTLYIDGTSVATTNNWVGSSNSTRRIIIGGNDDDLAGSGLDGYLTDVRFTIGKALYTSSFNPPTSPLTTTSQGAGGTSYVKFLAAQSSSITSATVINNGSSSDTGYTYGNPSSSTENPY